VQTRSPQEAPETAFGCPQGAQGVDRYAGGLIYFFRRMKQAPFFLFHPAFPSKQSLAGKRQTANGKRQTANGKRQTANGKRQKIMEAVFALSSPLSPPMNMEETRAFLKKIKPSSRAYRRPFLKRRKFLLSYFIIL
jgi:hypothetical protein